MIIDYCGFTFAFTYLGSLIRENFKFIFIIFFIILYIHVLKASLILQTTSGIWSIMLKQNIPTVYLTLHICILLNNIGIKRKEHMRTNGKTQINDCIMIFPTNYDRYYSSKPQNI